MDINSVFRRLKFLKSMRFGVSLLICISILSVVGTILPQGREAGFYLQENSSLIAELILGLGLDHLYSSTLFGVLFSLLALNMLLCNTARLGSIINRLKRRHDIERMMEAGVYRIQQDEDMNKALEHVFKSCGDVRFPKYKRRGEIYYSSKNVLGYFGSWLLHLGVMLIILFYIYGQATYYSQELYGVPREIRSIKNADFKAVIRDFTIDYREDGSIKQYTTQLDMLDGNNEIIKKGSTSVNSPMRYKGYSFYQTSTGWAADFKAYKDGVPIRAQVVYEGLACIIPEDNLAVAMTKFYPDFAANDRGFFSLSDKPNNPAILYGIYYLDEIVKMDIVKPGEKVKWNEFEFVIDNPQRYTYLQVNKMKGRFGAAAGGLLIITGLLLVFYFRPKELAVRVQGEVLKIHSNTDLVNQENYTSKISIKGNLRDKREGSINVR